MSKKQKKNRFEKLTMVACGFCPRQIVKEHERDKQLFIKDGKPMCMVCRAVKLSTHRKEIESSRPAMVKDLKGMSKKFDKEEHERMIHVAAEAQAQVEKKLEK